MPYISSDELNMLARDTAMYNSESSYKKLFLLLFKSLFQFSLGMLKSKELAEEVASDVMVILWQKRAELLQVENIKVYALAITRNLSLNSLKKVAGKRTVSLDYIHIDVESKNHTPDQILIQSQEIAELSGFIDCLPTRCKLVFKLIKEEGLSYKEVAAILNISTKTVDAHLVAAMKKLMKNLDSKYHCA